MFPASAPLAAKIRNLTARAARPDFWGRRIKPASSPFLLEGKNPFGYVYQAGWGAALQVYVILAARKTALASIWICSSARRAVVFCAEGTSTRACLSHRLLAENCQPTQQATFSAAEVGPGVQCAPIVPQKQIKRPPHMLVNKFALFLMIEQDIEKVSGLRFGHSLYLDGHKSGLRKAPFWQWQGAFAPWGASRTVRLRQLCASMS